MGRIFFAFSVIFSLLFGVHTVYAEMSLYPEEQMIRDELVQDGGYFPALENYDSALTAGVASDVVLGNVGYCTFLNEEHTAVDCPPFGGLFGFPESKKVTQGEFLRAYYLLNVPGGQDVIQKTFPGLTGNDLYVRYAWEYGVIDVYSASHQMTVGEALEVVYRHHVLEKNSALGIRKYFEGVVGNEKHISQYFFQDQDQIEEIIAHYDRTIRYQSSSARQELLGKRKALFEDVYFQVAQNDKTYQLRPHGNPVGAEYGEDVVLTYGFKDPRYSSHMGVDIAPFYGKKAGLGDIPIVARQSGMAMYIEMENQGNLGWSYGSGFSGYGNHVIILSEDFFRKVEGDKSLSKKKAVYATLYGHLSHFAGYDALSNPVYYEGLVKKFYNSSGWGLNYNPFGNVKIVGVKTVNVGDVLGYMGNTGRSTSDHLHYEVRSVAENKEIVQYVDPEGFQLQVPEYDLVYGDTMVGKGGVYEDSHDHSQE